MVSPRESLRCDPDCFCLCVLDGERAGQMEAQLRELGFKGEILRPDALKIFDARAATMRLLAEQIREENIPGDAAELGVFRGDFAALINAAFPDRTIHLFDTFEGFPARDVEIEQAQGLSRAKDGRLLRHGHGDGGKASAASRNGRCSTKDTSRTVSTAARK